MDNIQKGIFDQQTNAERLAKIETSFFDSRPDD